MESPAPERRLQKVMAMPVVTRIRRPLATMEEFLCPVIGTCLTLKELQKIARRFRYEGEFTPYNLHTWLIRACKNSPTMAKYVQKFLCDKYRPILRRLDGFAGEALLPAWEDAVQEGQVAGAFWAILTRLDVPAAIIEQVFGDVHMMSHLQASEVRTELKAFDSLRRDHDQLTQRLQKTRINLERQRVQREELRRRLAHQEAEVRQLRRQLAQTAKMLQSYQDTEVLTRLETENQALHRENQGLRSRLSQERLLTEKLERRLAHLKDRDRHRRPRFPVPAFRDCPEFCPPSLAGECPLEPGERCPGLGKKNILVVGGLEKLVPYYRGVVEEDFGACFFRHDGDFHQGHTCLAGMVKKAHAVICPIGVNSHEACLCVKKLCKRLNKPCVMLPKAGLGVLKKTLQQLAEKELTPEAGPDTVSIQ